MWCHGKTNDKKQKAQSNAQVSISVACFQSSCWPSQMRSSLCRLTLCLSIRAIDGQGSAVQTSTQRLSQDGRTNNCSVNKTWRGKAQIQPMPLSKHKNTGYLKCEEPQEGWSTKRQDLCIKWQTHHEDNPVGQSVCSSVSVSRFRSSLASHAATSNQVCSSKNKMLASVTLHGNLTCW